MRSENNDETESKPKIDDLIKIRATVESDLSTDIQYDVIVKDDTAVYDEGKVIDGIIVSGGLSAYRDPNDIRKVMVPKKYGTEYKNRNSYSVWSIPEKSLVAQGLEVKDDPTNGDSHVVIAEVGSSISHFKKALENTRDDWTEVPHQEAPEKGE